MACDLILVLDAQSPREVASTLRQLQGTVRWVKVGLEMFTACGPDCIREIAGLGFNVFLDLKLHDIPNTVAKAVESCARLPIGMLTLHTGGGREMMQWAVKAQQQHAPNLLLLGVTVLTSMSAAGLAETGVAATPGIDFDTTRGTRFIRFCYAGAFDDAAEAARRLEAWLK